MCGICQRQINDWYNEMPEINPFVAALSLRASDCVNCCILLITIWKSARLLSASLEGAKTLMAATVMRWSVPISSLDKDNPSSSVRSAPVHPGASICWLPPEMSCAEVGKGRQESAFNALGGAKGDRPTGKNALNTSANRGVSGMLEGHWRREERPFNQFLRKWGLIQFRVPTSAFRQQLSCQQVPHGICGVDVLE